MIKSDQRLKIDVDTLYMWQEDVASNSAKNSADIDGQIAYHNEMEHITNRAVILQKPIITEWCKKFTRP